VIELELTDRSVIDTRLIFRIAISERYVMVANLGRVLVFDKDGKFVRTIGRRGQGPGEFSNIRNIAIDEVNERLFILASPSKIIIYTFCGVFLNEIVQPIPNVGFLDINYIDGYLLLVVNSRGSTSEMPFPKHFLLYRLDDNFQVVDRQIFRTVYFERPGVGWRFYCFNNILKGVDATFLYYGENFNSHTYPTELVLRDTLLRIENNQIIPELRLRFRNDGIDRGGNKFIRLHSISRSSRFVFARYDNTITGNRYQFVFDMKTGESHNMRDGLIDDINNIEERAPIRPLTTNTEMILFWHTHMDPDSFDEPNPTLYIGRLRR